MLPESSYTRGATLAGKPLTGLVDARKALALFDEGATIVQGVHRYWPPLTRLIAELELELGHPCQANALRRRDRRASPCTPTPTTSSSSRPPSKQWEVHTPDGVEQVLLEPGVSMYLPTGTPHAARAQDTVSLHVTLGINQLTWRGLVERSLAPVLREAARRPPARRLPRPPRDPGRRPRGPARAARRRGARPGRGGRRGGGGTPLPHQPGTPLSGGLNDVLAVRDLGDETRLRRRPGHPCVVLDAANAWFCSVTVGRHAGLAAPCARQVGYAASCGRRTSPTSTRRAGWCSAGASSGKGCSRSSRRHPTRPLAAQGRRGVTPDQGLPLLGRQRLPRRSPLAGTASTVRAFLLIENTRTWGVDALRDSRRNRGCRPALRSAAAAGCGLMIRRPDRLRHQRGLRIFAAYADPSRGRRPTRSRTRASCSTSTWPRWARAARWA